MFCFGQVTLAYPENEEWGRAKRVAILPTPLFGGMQKALICGIVGRAPFLSSKGWDHIAAVLDAGSIIFSNMKQERHS